jgi:putative heme iron utilization protein
MSGKVFIITHMNADHGDSLQLYLQAFCGITAREANGASLEDLTLDGLVLRAQGIRYAVPVDPPMKDFSEARGRLVALHKDSLQRLGRSDVTLT